MKQGTFLGPKGERKAFELGKQPGGWNLETTAPKRGTFLGPKGERQAFDLGRQPQGWNLEKTPPKPPVSQVSNRLRIIAERIGQLEGFNKPGTLAQRQNNPGNLRFVGQQGAVAGDKGFARFPTLDAGWSALHRQINLDASRGKTLEQFVYKYAPPVENNSAAYLAALARALGVQPSELLSHAIR